MSDTRYTAYNDCVNAASAIVEAAELKLRRPALRLRPFVGCLWSIVTTADTHLRTLPDACTNLVVECIKGKPVKCFLNGPRLTPTVRTPGVGRVLFGVRLRPGVAFALTRRPVHEVVERRTLLAAILPDDASGLQRQLESAKGAEQGCNILEAFLLRRLHGIQLDPRIENALLYVEQSGGQVRISQLAKSCYVSCRHLNRLLLTWVGFSSKRLARIARFQYLLTRLEGFRSGGLAQLAAELGYYDQPHLANEVAKFAAESLGRIAQRDMADFSNTRCE